MFFVSKLVGLVADPARLLFGILILGVILGGRSKHLAWQKRGYRLTVLAAGGLLFLGALPVGSYLTGVLENRFPIPRDLPASVDGIIVLGGVVSAYGSEQRGQTQIGSSIERLTSMVELARRYPEAKIVFTGGSGSPTKQGYKEADAVKELLPIFAIDPIRVLLERESRNTLENAQRSKKLVNPQPEESWILVTSAFHMPRAVGVFRQQGWEILPYPVDYETLPNSSFLPTLDLLAGLSQMSKASHEWLGLVSYRIMGRTEALFPAP